MLHNMPRTHQGRIAKAPPSADDVAAIANELVVYVAKTQELLEGGERTVRPTKGLIQSHLCIGLTKKNLRCDKDIPRGQKKLTYISPSSGCGEFG